VVYTKTIIHLRVGESGGYLTRRFIFVYITLISFAIFLSEKLGCIIFDKKYVYVKFVYVCILIIFIS